MGLLKEIMLLNLMAFALIVSLYGVEGGRNIHREEDSELDGQLKLLNKQAIRTVMTEEGDVFNCVDITKQPAFDHPLLKNHSLQMEPSSLPKGMPTRTSSPSNPSEIRFKSLGCPQGTVPIMRIQKKDLIRIKTLPERNSSNASPLSGYHFAVARTKRDAKMVYNGGKSAITVYNPSVSTDQFTEGLMWVQSGPMDQLNSIQVGWTVNPMLFADKRTRLFAFWTADGYHKTGCFNILCPGFVQVSSDTTLGIPLEPYSVGERQYETEFLVFKDPKTGNWWLAISPHDTLVGYWPSSLFTSLASHADEIEWGGEVYSPVNEVAPAMGSGRFVSGEIQKTCYARRIQVVDTSNNFIELNHIPMEISEGDRKCYAVEYDGYRGFYDRYTILFGGPGGLNCI